MIMDQVVHHTILLIPPCIVTIYLVAFNQEHHFVFMDVGQAVMAPSVVALVIVAVVIHITPVDTSLLLHTQPHPTDTTVPDLHAQHLPLTGTSQPVLPIPGTMDEAPKTFVPRHAFTAEATPLDASNLDVPTTI